MTESFALSQELELKRWRTTESEGIVPAPDVLDCRVKDVVIDISPDSINWTGVGSFTFPHGSGMNDYERAEIMSFDSAQAQYVLITAVINYGGPCFGLSEIRIRAHDLCPDDQVAWIAGSGDWDVPSN